MLVPPAHTQRKVVVGADCNFEISDCNAVFTITGLSHESEHFAALLHLCVEVVAHTVVSGFMIPVVVFQK